MNKMVTLPICDKCDSPLKILISSKEEWPWICSLCKITYPYETKKATARLINE